MKKRILISAIEVSGDMHAANLVRAIKKIDPKIEFFGLGSEALRAEGAQVYRDLSHKSTVGLLEPLKHIFSFVSALKLLKKLMHEQKPAAFFCIDGQGFHLLAAKEAKKLGIPVIYYIAPQEWLWGTPAGGKKVAALCDLIIAIFPEEYEFYKDLGVKTVYNGHPLVDIVKPTQPRQEFLRKYQITTDKPLIGLFPGSRRQELKYLLPEFIKITEILKNKYNFLIVAANDFCLREIRKKINNPSVKLILKDNYNSMAAVDFIISSTGTITLEAALSGTPLLAVYKLSQFSYNLLCKSLGARMPKYKALPNMIAGREIMPEIIQTGVTAENLSAKIMELFAEPKKLEQIRMEFKKLRAGLERSDILAGNARDFLRFLSLR